MWFVVVESLVRAPYWWRCNGILPGVWDGWAVRRRRNTWESVPEWCFHSPHSGFLTVCSPFALSFIPPGQSYRDKPDFHGIIFVRTRQVRGLPPEEQGCRDHFGCESNYTQLGIPGWAIWIPRSCRCMCIICAMSNLAVLCWDDVHEQSTHSHLHSPAAGLHFLTCPHLLTPGGVPRH